MTEGPGANLSLEETIAAQRLPPLNWLRAFESAARLGSIKGAAEELFVTPAAVSQQVKKLEDYLGVELLLREYRRITLTPDGRRLRDGLSEAFQLMRRSVERLRSGDAVEHCLTVACGPPFASKWLAPKLAGFIAQHPQLNVRLDAKFETVDYRQSHIDIGVRLWTGANEGMDTIHLGEETLIPLAAPQYLRRNGIRAADDTRRATLICDGHGVVMPDAPDWADWFAAAGLGSPAAQRQVNFGDNVDQALDAAVHGVGMALGRRTLAHDDILSGRLVCPFGPELPLGRRWQVVKPRAGSKSPYVDIFESWLVEELTETLEMALPAWDG